MALGDTLLTGVVDVLAAERGGRQLVVDYKTDALDADTDLEAFVERHYGVQRRVYALAALRGGAARVEVAYAFLERPQTPICTTFEAIAADGLEHELLDARRRHARGRVSRHGAPPPRAVRELPGPPRAVLLPGGAHARRAPPGRRDRALRHVVRRGRRVLSRP